MASFNNCEKRMLRSIHSRRMFQGGDRVAAGVSGGKDSTFMLYMLARLRNRIKGGFHLSAYQVVDEHSPCSIDIDRQAYSRWCDSLDIPFHIIRPANNVKPGSPSISPCFLCARRRRKALFQRIHHDGFNILAFAHTSFDLAVTALMNLTKHGALETMPPALDFFQGKIRLIRPISVISVEDVIRFNRRIDAPPPPPSCPDTVGKARADMEQVVRNLTRENRYAVKNILRATARWESQ